MGVKSKHMTFRLEAYEGCYKSFLVQEDDYLLRLSRYVHLNQVRGINLGRGTQGNAGNDCAALPLNIR